MFTKLLPAALYTHQMNQSDGTGPSGQILGRLAQAAMNPDGSDRLVTVIEEDFTKHSVQVPATDTNMPAYGLTMVGDTGGTVAHGLTDLGGVLRLDTDGTEHDEIYIAGGGNCRLEDSSAVRRSIFFEARVNTSIATGVSFIGLKKPEATVTADRIIDHDVSPFSGLADEAFFGFYKEGPEIGTGGVLEFRMNKASGDETVIATELGPGLDGNGDPDGKVTGSHNLGFIFSQRESSSHDMLEIFVDNVKVASYTASQWAAIASADRLTTELMTFFAGVKNDAASANYLYLDWVYCYALMP